MKLRKQNWERVIEEIAATHHISPSEVRQQMLSSIEDARNNPDPAIRAAWNMIPRKGTEVTLEEFPDYLYAVTQGNL